MTVKADGHAIFSDVVVIDTAANAGTKRRARTSAKKAPQQVGLILRDTYQASASTLLPGYGISTVHFFTVQPTLVPHIPHHAHARSPPRPCRPTRWATPWRPFLKVGRTALQRVYPKPYAPKPYPKIGDGLAPKCGAPRTHCQRSPEFGAPRTHCQRLAPKPYPKP